MFEFSICSAIVAVILLRTRKLSLYGIHYEINENADSRSVIDVLNENGLKKNKLPCVISVVINYYSNKDSSLTMKVGR